MGRASSVEQLPPEILEQLQSWLRDPRVTQLAAVDLVNTVIDEVNAGLDDGDEPISHVSKSALNRYAQRMEQYGEKLRQSREIAEMWIAKVGRSHESELGQLNNELIRTLAFEVNMMLQDVELNAESMPGVVDMLKGMSLTMQRLEKAANESVKREDDIRRQERERLAEQGVEAAKAAGLDESQAAFWREQFLKGST